MLLENKRQNLNKKHSLNLLKMYKKKSKKRKNVNKRLLRKGNNAKLKKQNGKKF